MIPGCINRQGALRVHLSAPAAVVTLATEWMNENFVGIGDGQALSSFDPLWVPTFGTEQFGSSGLYAINFVESYGGNRWDVPIPNNEFSVTVPFDVLSATPWPGYIEVFFRANPATGKRGSVTLDGNHLFTARVSDGASWFQQQQITLTPAEMAVGPHTIKVVVSGTDLLTQTFEVFFDGVSKLTGSMAQAASSDLGYIGIAGYGGNATPTIAIKGLSSEAGGSAPSGDIEYLQGVAVDTANNCAYAGANLTPVYWNGGIPLTRDGRIAYSTDAPVIWGSNGVGYTASGLLSAAVLAPTRIVGGLGFNDGRVCLEVI